MIRERWLGWLVLPQNPLFLCLLLMVGCASNPRGAQTKPRCLEKTESIVTVEQMVLESDSGGNEESLSLLTSPAAVTEMVHSNFWMGSRGPDRIPGA